MAGSKCVKIRLISQWNVCFKKQNLFFAHNSIHGRMEEAFFCGVPGKSKNIFWLIGWWFDSLVSWASIHRKNCLNILNCSSCIYPVNLLLETRLLFKCITMQLLRCFLNESFNSCYVLCSIRDALLLKFQLSWYRW